MSCTFCRIIAGELEAQIVHRNSDVVVVLDHAPVYFGHCLVLPVIHHGELVDCPPKTLAAMTAMGKRVALAQRSALGCTGNFLALNAVVSQSVPHIHLHVVPRTRGDGMRGFFWPRTRYGSTQEAERYAALLGEAIERLG